MKLRTTSSALRCAERVIKASDRDHPADAVLRQELKAQRALSPAEAAQASRATFAYFRWRGWLDLRAPLSGQIEAALDLAARFAREPLGFSDAELVERAIPAWTREEMDVTGAWVRALQTEPKLWLRARPGQGRALAQKLGSCRVFGEGALADTIEYHGRQDLFRTEAFHAGEFEVQDLSSQIVSLASDARPGETWWDACAGEGGKLLHLSDLMQNKGLIWASDRADWRLQKLKRRAARARVFNFRAAHWDGSARPLTKTKFDGILVDAPCSGLGTWHRNPHARWTTTPKDVQELSDIQKRLLAHAAAALKPGGRLIYAACTLTRSETSEAVETFQRQFPGLSPLPFRNPLELSADPTSTLWIHQQDAGGNGMFIAAWKGSTSPS